MRPIIRTVPKFAVAFAILGLAILPHTPPTPKALQLCGLA